MNEVSPSELALQLEERISGISAEQQQLKLRLAELDRTLQKARLVRFWATTQIRLRNAVDATQTGRLFWVCVGPVFLAAGCFILTDLMTGFRAFSQLIGGTCLLICAPAIWAILKTTADLDLVQRAAKADQIVEHTLSGQRAITASLNSLAEATQRVSAQMADAQAADRNARQQQSMAHKLSQLYQKNWKAMRDEEFEKYLEEVLRTQGYDVETTSVTGDQGIDLVVTRKGFRIAIQVKGYHNSVGNAAVQQAFAGMAHYRCGACAVITNSRYSRGAVELAESTGCLLIDEAEFQNFVTGQLDLFSVLQHRHSPRDAR